MSKQKPQYTPSSPLNPSVEEYRRYIESGKLYRVGVRKSPIVYLRQTWERRAYMWKDSRAKVRMQNRQHRLGSWWLVIKPVFDVIFFWVLFGLILNTSRGMHNYNAYIIIGVLMFQYFSRALVTSSTVMSQNRSMMRAFSFPRLTVPISLALREALSSIPVIIVMIIGIVLIPPHVIPSWTWLLFIPAFLLNVLFNLGLGLIIARIAYVIPDISQVINVLTRFLLYGSAVIFPIERFIHHPVITHIIQSNPIYIFLDLYRHILMDHSLGTLYHWGSLGAWSIGLLLIGFFTFWHAEEVYGRELNN
ncbi:ABC transporter permease [Rothia sp. P6271]|uniref:ABC transporter permease n=1 Tax=unclassified Rothia (in: high G+C Gram-positive bacteria) TaxID=2689056 RepID=UPI003AC156E5